MAVAGVLATALTTHAARSKGLFLDGFDVIDQPTTNTVGYGVPIDSVTVVEQGPGAVSSMTFTIDDPNRAVTIVDGMEVRFEDFTLDQCLFLGYVDHYDVDNAFGNQGRTISIQAVGIDAALDWAILPADVVLTNTLNISFGVQQLYANSIGAPPLVALINGGGNSVDGKPIAGNTNTMATGLTIPAGTSLREGIRQAAANVPAPDIYKATIDFRAGLRFYSDIGFSAAVNYANMTVTDHVAPLYGEPTSYGVDSAQYRGVFIDGGGAAGTGVKMDGTGKAGPVAYIRDTTITTAAALLAAQQAFLGLNTPTARGSIMFEDMAPLADCHPGSNLSLSDTHTVGPGTSDFTIAGITKTFNSSTRENWTVSFGGAVPALTDLIRRYTKDARA